VTGLVQGRALLDGWCSMRRRGRRYERCDELVAAPRNLHMIDLGGDVTDKAAWLPLRLRPATITC